MQEIDSNILDTLKLDAALRLAKKKSKEGSFVEIELYIKIYLQIPKE